MSRALNKRVDELLDVLLGGLKEAGIEIPEDITASIEIMERLKTSKKDHSAVVAIVENAEQAKEMFEKFGYTPKDIKGNEFTAETFFTNAKYPILVGNPYLDETFTDGVQIEEMAKVYKPIPVGMLPEVIKKEMSSRTKSREMMEKLFKELFNEIPEQKEEAKEESLGCDCEGCSGCEKTYKYFISAVRGSGEPFNRFIEVNGDLDEANAMESFYMEFRKEYPNAVITFMKELI